MWQTTSSAFGSVAELRDGFGAVRVVDVVEDALGFAAPLHFIVLDPTGDSVVIESLTVACRSPMRRSACRPTRRATTGT